MGTDEHSSARVPLDVPRIRGGTDLPPCQDGVVSSPQVVGGEVRGAGGGANAIHGKEWVVKVDVLHVGSRSVTAGRQT